MFNLLPPLARRILKTRPKLHTEFSLTQPSQPQYSQGACYMHKCVHVAHSTFRYMKFPRWCASIDDHGTRCERNVFYLLFLPSAAECLRETHT